MAVAHPLTRTTYARLAGFMFLFYIATAMPSMIMADAATSGAGIGAKLANIAHHAPQMRLIAVLSLITIFDALVLGIALFAITRDTDFDLAVLGLACRVGEGVISAVYLVATLALAAVAADAVAAGAPDVAARTLGTMLLRVQGWTMIISATCFAVGSTVFSYLFLRGRSIPAPLAWLGIVASLLLVIALPAELAGYIQGALGWSMWLPMLAFEVSLGFWLLIKGVPSRPDARPTLTAPFQPPGPMPSAIHVIRVVLVGAFVLASSASAQSIDRAKQLFDNDRYAEAKAELLAAQKTNDRNPVAAYYLGRIAMIENESDEAVRYFERALKLEEGNALYHTWLGNALRDVTPRSGKIRMAFNARRMRKEWERAVQLDPNQIDARYGLVMFYSMAPGAMGGSKEKAREQVTEIARRNAMRGAIARGLLADVEKDVSAEEAAYKQAIAASPDSAAGYFALGLVYAREGKAAEAFATLDQYSKRQPQDKRALYEAGRFAGTTGQQLDRGETALKQFLASPPPDAPVTHIAGAHYWLGQIAETRGAKDAAREHYRTALKINKHSQLSERALSALK